MKATQQHRKRTPQDSMQRKVRIFLRRINRREVVSFLGCLLMAFAFWLMSTAYEENDVTLTVRLTVTGQPDDHVFTTHVPQEIKLSLRDNNYRMVNYFYESSLKDLEVDFYRYADLAGNFRIPAAELEALFKASLKPSTQITAILPALIDARYAVADGKRLPVRLDMDCRPAPDHRCGQPVVTPDTVLVHAPAAVIDTMTMIATRRVERLALTDTLRETVELDLPIGVNATPAQVEVVVPVAQYVERTFAGVPIRTDDVPYNVRLNLFPYTASVVCLVDFNYYRELSADDFLLSVSVRDIRTPSQQKLPIRLLTRYGSEHVSGVRVVPDSVEYVIERLQ